MSKYEELWVMYLLLSAQCKISKYEELWVMYLLLSAHCKNVKVRRVVGYVSTFVCTV